MFTWVTYARVRIRVSLYLLTSLIILLLNKMVPNPIGPKISEKEHAFWRALIRPEEERRAPWDGKGYRWFKSPNVIPLEQWRVREDQPERRSA
jgi:hypothetical protein